MKKIVLIIAFIFGVNSLIGQNNDIKKPFIEINGTSETEITPDEIYITITLLERSENKEKLTIDKQEENLKQNIKELGIDISNLTLNTADADYGKLKTFKKDVIISKSYTLKIGNADLVGKLYERLDKINVHDAYVSKLSHSKILEFTKENRIKAVKAAKEKVDYLLAALGQQAGAPIQITEVDNSIINSPYNYRGGRSSAGYMSNAIQSYGSYGSDRFLDEGTNEISFKKIKIKSSFLVKYEILNK